MANKGSITPIQQMVLGFMREFFAQNDQLPPMQHIADHFGWPNASNAHHHVSALIQRGHLERNAVGKYRFARGGADA